MQRLSILAPSLKERDLAALARSTRDGLAPRQHAGERLVVHCDACVLRRHESHLRFELFQLHLQGGCALLDVPNEVVHGVTSRNGTHRTVRLLKTWAVTAVRRPFDVSPCVGHGLHLAAREHRRLIGVIR